MPHREALASILAGDRDRLRALHIVRATCGPEFWIGAGFVRNLVWARVHQQSYPITELADIDVIVYATASADPAWERAHEARLHSRWPAPWSVTNQARMARRNGHTGYHSLCDAMRHWPETATAVACRLDDNEHIEILAPFGLEDLFADIIRPTSAHAGDPAAVHERVTRKGWLTQWPNLRFEASASQFRRRDGIGPGV